VGGQTGHDRVVRRAWGREGGGTAEAGVDGCQDEGCGDHARIEFSGEERDGCGDEGGAGGFEWVGGGEGGDCEGGGGTFGVVGGEGGWGGEGEGGSMNNDGGRGMEFAYSLGLNLG